MQSWILLLLANVATASQSVTLPTGCSPIHLSGAQSAVWSPSFPIGRMLPIALKRPTKTWQEFTFVFQSVDNATVATLKAKKPGENVMLVLKRWDYASSDNEGVKDQQVIQLSREASQQFSLQDWTFVSLSVDGGRLWLALKGVSFARFDDVVAKGFHRVYVFVTNGHYMDVSFYCDEGGVVGETTPEELDKTALAVIIVLAVMLLLLIPLAIVCFCMKRRRTRRRSKSAREEPVRVERKVVKDAVHRAYVEMPEIRPLMTGYLIGAPEEAEEGHGNHNVVEENVPRDISEENGESVSKDDRSLSADIEEANTQCSEAPKPHLEEEQAEDVTEDESNEPEEISAKDQSAEEANASESGHENNDGTADIDGKDAEAVGEPGPEVGVHDVDEQVEVHDADEHKKNQGEKFLRGLMRTREQASASLAGGSRGGEAGNPTEASDDSSNDVGAEDDKEPAGKSVDKLIDIQEKNLADLINEMLYYSRTSGVTGEHRRTGDDRDETNQHDGSREMTTDEMAEGATGDAGEGTREAPNVEPSGTPGETGVEEDPAVESPREIDGRDETNDASETVARESVETDRDSTLDETERGSEIQDGGGDDSTVSEGKEEDSTETDASPIVFPVGNSDYGVEKFREARIEAVYSSDTPEEENTLKAKPKKVYRPTPLTSLKFP